MPIDQINNLIKLPASYLQLIDWFSIFSIVFSIISLVFGIFLIYQIIRLILSYKSIRLDHVTLEIKPLRETEQSSYSTQQLFNLFHNIATYKSPVERLFNVKKVLSLEVISTKKEGIRYVIRIPAQVADTVKNNLISYLPGIQVQKIADLEIKNKRTLSISILKLANHFVFPLRSQENLDMNDPIAYLTGNMTKLQEDELMIYQLLLTPLKKSGFSEIGRISKLIYSKKDLPSNISATSSIFILFHSVIARIMQIALLPLGLLIFIVTGAKEGPLLPITKSFEKNKTTNPYQEEMEQIVKQKIDQPLFESSVRIVVDSSSARRSSKKKSGFVSALVSMSSTQYQFLKQALNLNLKVIKELEYLLFKHRVITPFTRVILSSSELGDLYHFPYTKTTKTEDIQKQFSKELPAPLSLKQGSQLDVVFAKNTYANSDTPIGLTEDERRRHIYILGATGTGKSTMLLSMINSDLQKKKGLAVVDPHGDLIEQVLRIIPENRINDVIYFNPDDIGYPIGINLLELTKGLCDEDQLREQEYIAESIISLFHKIYSDKYSGPRMEYILRNTIYTAFSVPNATLFTVYKLLINTPFRKSVVKNLTDPNLLDFWKYEFAKAGDYQKVKMISPITNKIGRFLFSPTAKRILDQEKSTIDFDQIMNEGKILLCNLSKGKIGEDNSKVLGVVMMAKLQLTSLKRARMSEDQRRDFYLYVDEFQNFATPAFAQVLSEARKYRLAAVLAHQTTSQLEDSSLVNITLANTGTVICFRTANPEDERLILPQFRPYIKEGEIASLPSYRFYMRLGALNPEEPFSGITIPIKIHRDDKQAQKVIESSRKLYAMKFIYPTKINTSFNQNKDFSIGYKKTTDNTMLP